MAKTINNIMIEGRNYTATIITCESCSNEINPQSEPCIVVQTAITVVYPSGQTEPLQLNNEANGRFNHYCGKCLMMGKIPTLTEAELVRFKASLPENPQPPTGEST